VWLWYSFASYREKGEDGVRKLMVLAGGLVLLAGCGMQVSKSPSSAVEPKWKGAPYRLAFEPKVGKPNTAAVIIPAVDYTANPDALETRAVLVMRFAGAGAADSDENTHLMIGVPVDIHGDKGTLPADYLDKASKGLTDYLAAHCIQGNVKVSLALARSSLDPLADNAKVDAVRLSDWLPFEVVFKRPHLKC